MIGWALKACDGYLMHVHRSSSAAGEAVICWALLWATELRSRIPV